MVDSFCLFHGIHPYMYSKERTDSRRSLKDFIFFSVSAEPAVTFTVFRHHGFHFSPECPRVIELLQMRQLMDDNIIDDLHRQHSQLPVELQVLFSAAASPEGGLVFDIDIPAEEARGPDRRPEHLSGDSHGIILKLQFFGKMFYLF